MTHPKIQTSRNKYRISEFPNKNCNSEQTSNQFFEKTKTSEPNLRNVRVAVTSLIH